MTHRDYDEAIWALMEGLETFQGAGHNVVQSASLRRISAFHLVPEETIKTIYSFSRRAPKIWG